ncbi:sugar O-acyltransferase, sialic acid O-acetyltransferase NeuD family [Trichococcus flocculiformis]|uniref:acetyltransferase n=1 Tax=Trichococcus TaxID=82802 RepID=UPI0007A8DA31|nr:MULTISPECIES: acetyltransferase [Trichococcus]CZR10836.1 Hypothetical protein TES5_2946 [Trichococcus sp. ES5]SHG27297.1 sugar O-acyltransferase, sialic acid O-acetyltransferase NeuD family [Trichococcus flocculiformis]
MEKVLLIGGGGHCASIIDSMNQQALYEPVGILDIPEKVGEVILGVPVIGTDDEAKKYFQRGVKRAFISLGSIGDTKLRQKLYQQMKDIGFTFPTVTDPTAIVSPYTQIGEGTFIGKGAVVNATVIIGTHAIINTGTIVEHDGVIGDFVHLAPGTTLSGTVTIGDHTHLGTNSTVIQSISIGENTIIGAGSVVIKSIGAGKKAYGNPCREVE